MGLLSSFDISASGLTAQRVRMDVISNNIANADATKDNKKPFQRQMVLLKERVANRGQVSRGVAVRRIMYDTSPGRMVYDPGHPDADDNGYVAYPNVNIVVEMTDMISASRAYEANVTALNAAKGMAMKALEIGRV
jgi:flagellar basal-body rod protein FlgC